MRDLNKNKKLLFFGPLVLFWGIFGLTILTSSNAPVHDSQDAINIDELMKKVLDLNQKKQHQKAIDVLLLAVEKQKDDSLLRTLLVQTFDLFLSDEIERGQEQIQKNRKDQSAYLSVAGALELLGDNFRAMEILLNGIAHKPSTSLWMRIANLELKSGRDLEALDVFLEVIRLDKNNSLAHNNAAFILAKMTKSKDDPDLVDAEKLAKRAIKLEPKNPQYIDTLAEVYFRKGEQSAAENLIKQAIKLAPESEQLKNRLEHFENDFDNMFIAK